MGGVLPLLRRGRRRGQHRGLRPADRAAPRCADPRLLGRPQPAAVRAPPHLDFARNAYRHGVLGRFIGVGHASPRLRRESARAAARAHARRTARSSSRRRSRRCSTSAAVRWATANRLSLYGLGIPPAQYEALAGGGDMAHVLRARLERLTCGFSLDDNYFAWQAFGRPMPRCAGARCRPICGASISRWCAARSIASRS